MARKVRRDEQYTIVEPSYSYSYSASPYGQPVTRPKHRLTSTAEIRDIAAAIGVLSVAFYLIFYVRDARGVLYYAVLAALSVLAGFFVHEMSHKAVARMYGCWAEFRADYRMLGFALLMSVFGFLFAAPGAVLIMGNIGPRENGKISLAGPASNLLVALACLPFWMFSMPGVSDTAVNIAYGIYFFSVFLGAFNMIPIMPFDGAKIWRWNKAIYIVTLLCAGLMLFIAYY